MSRSPFIPFYPSDWLAGTRGLTAAETGIYITLIAMMYEREAPLEADYKRLARLCGATVPSFMAALDSLVSEAKITVTNGALWNARVQVELGKRSEKRESARDSAKARWRKAPQKQAPYDADAMRNRCETDANQKPEPDKKIETYVSISPQRKRSGVSDPPGFADFWEAYPRKIAKGAARKAWIMAASLTDPPTIIAAASRVEDRGRYTPNPATWLNAERWLDQTENRNDQRPSTPGNGHAILDAAARASARFATPGTDPRGPGGSGGCAAGMDSGARGDAAGASFPARRSGTSH